MAKLNRIIETALYVASQERAARFYEDVLELEPLSKTDVLFAYDVGGLSVLLLFKRGATVEAQHLPGGIIPPHDGSGQIHLCFAVNPPDLSRWESRLAEKQIPLEGRMTWSRGGKSIYFRDPDAHLLELMTPGVWRTY